MRIVAVDIGGTMIKSGLWNGETFVELRETETRASEGGAALMERVKGLIHSYHDFEAIGISTAGEVNTEDGSIFYANTASYLARRQARTAIFRATQACR